ncbi:MAG TPA: hypothetical protein VE957_13160 [Terriglobales bacterium]|nr:hypothetical protein [Terriglobales bacterium]
MRHARSLKYIAFGLALSFLLQPRPLHAQAEVQKTVRDFLQAWYVDRQSPEQLKSYIAKDNGFNLVQKAQPTGGREAATATDPVNRLFTDAFTKGTSKAELARPKTLSEMIEYAPAKKTASTASSGQLSCMASIEFALCKPGQLPKGAVLPANKPSGKDPVANYLWHLNQDYKNKLYIVLYSTKGAGLLRETAILYWIQEGNSWKLAAFEGTNW